VDPSSFEGKDRINPDTFNKVGLHYIALSGRINRFSGNSRGETGEKLEKSRELRNLG
jgi:hypothetical protein